MPIPQTGKRYTYADYVTWSDDERWEIIDGVAYNMTPAPTIRHQKITGYLLALLQNALRGHACTPLIAPVDVVLSDHDVVQPDILVVCDPAKITKANIQGAPDLVIEVLSPGTVLKDRREKKALYEHFGVKEYVMVDAEAPYVEHLVLNQDGAYGPAELLGREETLKLRVAEGLKVNLAEMFEE